MQYLITLDIPEETKAFVLGLREKYSLKQERVLEPHITMVPPFKVDYAEEILIEKISQIKFNAFKAVISGLDFWSRKRGIIILKVVPSNMLTQLYLRFRNLLEDDNARRGYGPGQLFRSEFVPHVMIDKRMPIKKFLAVKQQMEKIEYEVSWKVKGFDLYSCEDDGMWEKVGSFS
ncbi:2'-5' RNA ligase family protein [Candidatus Dojkabacteria bacterium]|nr:2'-5' RNA ligase family protein [Candidatus Dojkabacteria bacterium]